ncbi:MAG: thioredoxin-disulfide reductase [Chloroflexi bacterium]|nr:thioredoxin-disulfide reductase [Chloroflexota bacterium]
MDKQYDVIIVGAGPTGMTAAIYTGRARLKTLLIERMTPGGQIATTSTVENYPGFTQGIEGPDLSEAMETQTKRFGAEMLSSEVHGVSLDGLDRVVHTDDGDVTARALIVTSGAEHARLGVPGELEYMGKGVSNCAVCDAAFFVDSPVAVVGGGDAALDEGLFLTRYASKVTLIHRRDQLRAGKILQERAFAEPKMEFQWDTVVERINGNGVVSSLSLKNAKTGAPSSLEVEGVFIYIGLTPNSNFLQGLLPMDNAGHILVNAWMETAVPGIFAAGDIRQQAARQVVSAAGDGATAALAVRRYLQELRAKAGE